MQLCGEQVGTRRKEIQSQSEDYWCLLSRGTLISDVIWASEDIKSFFSDFSESTLRHLQENHKKRMQEKRKCKK